MTVRIDSLLGFFMTVCVILAACSPASAKDLLAELSGQYSRHFKNGDISGDHYWRDDVVEIVPVSSSAAYIRVELSFQRPLVFDERCRHSGG